ncbi:hypothetical protein [[Mycobacterium] crassicus]|uniref:PEP-CTERM sorting domain-containing protein n=1 Tax=[Mycobacterium] crassicus TaxID=2872309 RepID=A0ABU5XFN4_9MYCO|nr:hypothetical protein [Mycolicibacter sp. MYC098]MEB3020688.1 hypothetical protein [Mycolicibacter sp. MYC098]
MNMRKIVVIGGLAAGATFVLAPLASAIPDPLTPVVDSEVASMNFLFGTDTFLSGVPSSDIELGPQGFDIIKQPDVHTVQDNGTTLFDYLVYGLNPKEAGLASDPGAYNVYNGSMVAFDDGINSLLHAAASNGGVLDWDSGDLFGGNSLEHIANNADTGWAEAMQYFQFAWGDLMGYFGIFSA